MRREIVSGIVTGDELVSHWPTLSLSPVTVPEVFAKVNSAPGTCFSKSPETFRDEGKFKITTFVIVAQFLAHKPVNFASLTDSFIVSLSELLKLGCKHGKHKTPFSAF